MVAGVQASASIQVTLIESSYFEVLCGLRQGALGFIVIQSSTSMERHVDASSS